MVAEVISGISAIRNAIDLARDLKDMHEAHQRAAAVIEIQTKLISAQAEHLDLQERVRQLEREIDELRKWNANSENYELVSLGKEVYAYADQAASSETTIYLCTNCFDQRQKSILHREQTEIGVWTVYHCNRCSGNYYPQGLGRHSNEGARSRR